MKTKAALLALLAELDGDLQVVQRIARQNARAWERIQQGAVDPIDWGALGYTLHGFYGAIENYCLRISKYFENALPPDRWHKSLLDKMRLDIPGVRPPLFTKESDYDRAQQLMKFRHRFRNLYGEDLDPKKTGEVQRAALSLFSVFPRIHSEFRAKIRSIAEGLP